MCTLLRTRTTVLWSATLCTAVALGCNTRPAATGGVTPSEYRDSFEETQRRNDVAAKMMEEQRQRFKTTQQLLDRTVQQADRYDKLLDRWEAQADRKDRLLEAEEQKAAALREPVTP